MVLLTRVRTVTFLASATGGEAMMVESLEGEGTHKKVRGAEVGGAAVEDEAARPGFSEADERARRSLASRSFPPAIAW